MMMGLDEKMKCWVRCDCDDDRGFISCNVYDWFY